MSEFLIENKSSADWAIEKIAEAQREIEENNDYVNSQIEKTRLYQQEINEVHQNTIDFFEGHLQLFLKSQGAKSMKLINGNIGFRARQSKFVMNDTDTLIKTLESSNLNDLIRVKKEPALNEIRKQYSVVDGKLVHNDTGEILDGIEAVDQDDSFNLKIK